jgi:transposase
MERVCGLDVHKDSVFMCILTESGEKIEEVFGTLTADLERLRDRLVEHHVGRIAMESTSVYWIPIWRILETDFDVKLVNPYFLRQLPGRKTDVKDAHWIATILQKDLIKGSFVPENRIQELRLYNRRIAYLNRNLQRADQSIDLILQRCNIRLSNYVTDVGGKSMRKVVRAISQGQTDPEVLVSLVHTRTKNKHGVQAMKDAVTGVLSPADMDVLTMALEEAEFYEKQLTACQEKLVKLCGNYYREELELLQTVPGIKETSAASIIAEVGVDMKYFQTASNLVGWTGLRPRNDQSAGKIKGRKTLHGNKYLRIMLVQCAWGASRTKSSLFYSRFNVLKKRMNHKKALIANARKLLVVIWNILAKRQAYMAKAA